MRDQFDTIDHLLMQHGLACRTIGCWDW